MSKRWALALAVAFALTLSLASAQTSTIFGGHSFSPQPTAAPTPTLPPQGVYNSCEIDSAIASCESQDSAMVADGFVWEINYIGLLAHKTGAGSLNAIYTYDAGIGMGQLIAVERALSDSDALTGTGMAAFYTSLAADCGATTNAQIISCVYGVASAVPSFNYKWYIYDEPGCPGNTSYCSASSLGNYNNVSELAGYIRSIDPTHQIIGTQVGDTGSPQQTVTNNMFCWIINTTATPCPTPFPISGSTSPMPSPPAIAPIAGFDRYPVPQGTATPPTPQKGLIGDVGTIATALGTTISTYNSSAQTYYVGQAFSWFQADGGASPCTTITICPFPTTVEMQAMRDNALFYGYANGTPMQMILWYYWPYVTCVATYTGCNSATNQASLVSAAFAPWPNATPTAVP